MNSVLSYKTCAGWPSNVIVTEPTSEPGTLKASIHSWMMDVVCTFSWKPGQLSKRSVHVLSPSHHFPVVTRRKPNPQACLMGPHDLTLPKLPPCWATRSFHFWSHPSFPGVLCFPCVFATPTCLFPLFSENAPHLRTNTGPPPLSAYVAEFFFFSDYQSVSPVNTEVLER